MAGEVKVGLQSYVDVFSGNVRNTAQGSTVAWSTVWFVVALLWLALAFYGSRNAGRG